MSIYFNSEKNTIYCWYKKIIAFGLQIYKIESLAIQNLVQKNSELELIKENFCPSSFR